MSAVFSVHIRSFDSGSSNKAPDDGLDEDYDAFQVRKKARLEEVQARPLRMSSS